MKQTRWISVVLVALSVQAYSQTFEGNAPTVEHEASVWARAGVQLLFDSLPLSLTLDTQLRAGGKQAEFQTLQGRVHLNYHFSPQTSVSVGGIAFTPQRGIATNIALLQAIHSFASEGVQPALRIRWDYRWQTNYNLPAATTQASWRLRLQPILLVPIAQSLKLLLNNEFFFEEQSPWLIDENRFQVGLQWKVASNLSLLTAYQNRAFFGEKTRIEHTLFLVLLWGLRI
ncbi:MAG: DUF2490 domain-containing protein [Chloroherpetonaceae bacterium]|nr:DUF2490 domain-containing protein [Chloroherpetonaceae bacterium]